jgi:hypothetical protein
MAGNTSGLVDLADGDFDDWFELFNAGPTAVDLSGFTLTDDLGDPNQWTIPNGTTIPAGGYLLVWADQETGQAGASGSDLHANFRLGLEGDNIGLFAPNSDLIDSVTFGPQTNDVSQGRWPDGNSGVFQFMTNSTPRAANVLGTENNQPPVLGFIPDQSVFQGSPLTLTARATDPNVAQTKTFTLDPGAPSSAFINASSGVFTWTPTAADFIGDHFLTVRVADNGSPPLSDFQTLKITVLSPPGLEFTSIVANGDGTVTFRWASQPQRTYRVYFKTVLAQLAWSPLADVLATGTELSLTDDTSPDQQRFYYVERLP